MSVLDIDSIRYAFRPCVEINVYGNRFRKCRLVAKRRIPIHLVYMALMYNGVNQSFLKIKESFSKLKEGPYNKLYNLLIPSVT